ncbi:hypothetical protein QAO71_16985 (plasmid) [Halopseudomonas sp. SMJS2]|nr:hypothetical protein [Halopseudomonas sp. SMJS2]WGK63466.1 hypothetical protein QAO71_16985 [Halopseudomonas sp. SMJS2]
MSVKFPAESTRSLVLNDRRGRMAQIEPERISTLRMENPAAPAAAVL